MRGVFLEDLTWPEAGERFRAGAVVLVPVGAFAKEHGPHLPLNTDARVARELARRVAELLPVVVAPVIGFGYYPAFVRYPGSQHLNAGTFGALVAELAGNLIAQGATSIAILNNGVSTEGPLRIAARELWEQHGVKIAIADTRLLGRGADALLKHAAGGHADERETSIMLRIDAAAVRMERAAAGGHAKAPSAFQFAVTLDPDHNASGVIGDPAAASAEKGEALLREMTRELVEGLVAAFPQLAQR